MVDLLEDLIRRQYGGDYPTDTEDPYQSQPGATPGSWLDQLTRKKKQAFADMPPPTTAAPPFMLPGLSGAAGALPSTLPALNYGAGTPDLANPDAGPAPDDTGRRPPRTFGDWLPKTAKAGIFGPQPPIPGEPPKASREPSGEPTPPPQEPTPAPPPPQNPLLGGVPNPMLPGGGVGMLPGGEPTAQPPPAPAPQPQQKPPIPTQGTAGPLVAGVPGTQGAGMLGSLGGLGQKIMQGLHEHSNMLLALGAGLAGAPTFAQGMSRGFAGAMAGNQADIQNAMESGSQSAMEQALLQSGASPAMARAGAMNKDVGRAMLGSYLDPKYEIKEVKTKNAWGEEDTQMYAIDPRNPTEGYNITTGERLGGRMSGGNKVGIINSQGQFVPANADQAQRIASGAVGGGAAAGGGGGGGTAVSTAPTGPVAGPIGGQPQQGAGPPQSEFYAPGINDQNLDWSKNGDDFLNQFGPGVKAAVQDRLAGLVPTGRSGGMSGGPINRRIQMIAEKYGRDIGHPDDPTKYTQRNQYATNLANPDRGVGKRKWGLQQSTEHLAEISDNLVKMKLKNVPLILGGEMTSAEINKIRANDPEQARLVQRNKMLAGNLGRELGAMAGGSGVHEAEARANALSGTFGSGKAAAGAVEGVQQIMQGSLETLQRERDDLFPDERYRPAGSDFLSAHEQALLDHIQHNMDILNGKAPADTAPAAAPAAAPPVKPGGRYVFKNGALVEQ